MGRRGSCVFLFVSKEGIFTDGGLGESSRMSGPISEMGGFLVAFQRLVDVMGGGEPWGAGVNLPRGFAEHHGRPGLGHLPVDVQRRDNRYHERHHYHRVLDRL